MRRLLWPVLKRRGINCQNLGLTFATLLLLVKSLSALVAEPLPTHHLADELRHAELLALWGVREVFVQVVGNVYQRIDTRQVGSAEDSGARASHWLAEDRIHLFDAVAFIE